MYLSTDLNNFNFSGASAEMIDQDVFLNSDSEVGSLEYWEEFERMENIRARREDGLLDALDFECVPFESVEEQLVKDLYDEDLTDSGYWDEDEAAREERVRQERMAPRVRNMTHISDLVRENLRRREQSLWDKRVAWAEKFRNALEEAKRLRPDLNWESYRSDDRMYP